MIESVDPAQRDAIMEARRRVDPDARVDVFAPPCVPPLAHGEAFCTDVLSAPSAVVVFHARTVDEGCEVLRCLDCGKTTDAEAKA